MSRSEASVLACERVIANLWDSFVGLEGRVAALEGSREAKTSAYRLTDTQAVEALRAYNGVTGSMVYADRLTFTLAPRVTLTLWFPKDGEPSYWTQP